MIDVVPSNDKRSKFPTPMEMTFMRIAVRIKLFGRIDKKVAPLCTGFRGSIGRFAKLFHIHHTLPWHCHRTVYDGTVSKLMDKATEDQWDLEDEEGITAQSTAPRHYWSRPAACKLG